VQQQPAPPSIPAGNSWKSVKQLNCKGASTISGISRDGKVLFVMNRWQTLSIIPFAAVLAKLQSLGVDNYPEMDLLLSIGS